MEILKVIRFLDLSELGVYNIIQSGDNLVIDFLNADMNVLMEKFAQKSNISQIEYYANGVLISTFTDFVVYVSVSDKSAGMVEVDGKIQTIIIRKKTLEERVEEIEERLGL